MKIDLRRLLATMLLGLCLAAPAGAQEQSSGDAQQPNSPAMQKSMDPNVWIKLMNSMMSGQLQGQPMISSCVECHSGEDIARYQQQYGPMMQSMQPMMQMANPQMFGQMPGVMMAPMGGMMAPMMAPMGNMMMPMTGMMMNPMTGMMMNPMTGMMMNPMTGMMMMPGMMPGMPPTGMMPGMPPTGMMPGMPPTGMMPGMPPMGMMPGMPSLPHPGGPIAPGTQPGQPQIMDPKQYEQFYKQWQDMMSKMMPAQPDASSGQ